MIIRTLSVYKLGLVVYSNKPFSKHNNKVDRELLGIWKAII